MKTKINIIFIFLIFCTPLCYSQKNLGSAKSLKGDTYVLCCFISDENHDWTSQEKMDVSGRYREALNWIKNQAVQYNDTVYLNFEIGTYGYSADIKLDNIEYGTGSGKEDARMVTRVLQKVGYSNSMSFYKWVTENTKCTNAFVLIFVKGQGRGYAMVFKTKESNEQIYFMEGAMLYEKRSNNYNTTPSEIAHEILHLFGAWDLYTTFEQTKDREDKAREMFPNSIMLRASPNINDLNVDEVTAWLIGWKDDSKPWYEWFRPH